MKILNTTFMMTNHRHGLKPQNNDLATQKSQDKDSNFGFDIALLVDGLDARAPTLMGTGLLLLLSRCLRSDDVSNQEAMNRIKILVFQSMFALLSVEPLIKCF